ncbi:hypothetical protein I532_04205 [Brevibacillus borstelensis AK1]|uniref:Ead/Ea22-like family protein n=1 Tax=Brevibacillus borstelensis AK1 TaxID=1300222 RepID=M8DEK5_9BACL|nr:hypothetical protein [Brevibacillus borstelensis]EMT54779.1 hypothetical protein I532_04205 [Brevibacillus borstelensis AK1]
MTATVKHLTPEEIAATRERAEKATPGPWRVVPDNIGGFPIFDVQDRLDRSLIHTVEDAEFIAHAREDIPKLLAEVERLRTALAEMATYEAPYGLEAEGYEVLRIMARQALDNGGDTQ